MFRSEAGELLASCSIFMAQMQKFVRNCVVIDPFTLLWVRGPIDQCHIKNIFHMTSMVSGRQERADRWPMGNRASCSKFKLAIKFGDDPLLI